MAEKEDKPEAEKSENPLASIGGLIPSLYYDVIARVIPGAVFILCLKPQPDQMGDSLHLLLLLGGGYVIGILLTPFYYLVTAPVGLCLWCVKRMSQGRKTPFDWRGIMRNDAVGVLRPDLGAMLAKMQAECVLCCNVATELLFLKLATHTPYANPFVRDELRQVPPALFWCFLSFVIVVAWLRYVAWRMRQDHVVEILKKSHLKFRW